jgi:GNAT superfamily N-acetyltransferase
MGIDSDDLTIVTLADRPDLAKDAFALKRNWPAFMMHDPVGDRFYTDVLQDYPDFILVACSPEHPDSVLACGFMVPIGLAEAPPAGLPENGWDGAIRLAHLTRLAGYKGDAVCLLECMVRQDLRARGIAVQMLRASLEFARRRGFAHLLAPVRPPGKASVPTMSIDEYAHQKNAEGLPKDPLLRAHVRLGATMAGFAKASMVVAAPVEKWREWTGLPFDKSGPVIVPEALVPVHCDLANGYAVYVEPNVWFHTPLR